MPIGALISSKEYLATFTNNPMLGHITTFGGHPVVCAAANACLDVMTSEINYSEIERLGQLLESIIETNSEIIEIRRKSTVAMMVSLS